MLQHDTLRCCNSAYLPRILLQQRICHDAHAATSQISMYTKCVQIHAMLQHVNRDICTVATEFVADTLCCSSTYLMRCCNMSIVTYLPSQQSLRQIQTVAAAHISVQTRCSPVAQVLCQSAVFARLVCGRSAHPAFLYRHT